MVFSGAIRRRSGIRTAAVGLISTSVEANRIVQSDQADLVMFGRAYLADPYLPRRFAQELGVDVQWPNQVARESPPDKINWKEGGFLAAKEAIQRGGGE